MRKFFHGISVRFVLKLAKLAAFGLVIFLLLGLVPSEIMKTVGDVAEEVSEVFDHKGVSASDLHREEENVSLAIVYAERDGSYRAEALAVRLRSLSYVRAEIYSENEYAAEAPSVRLSIFLGYSSFYGRTYLDTYKRLGEDGLEISHSENSEGVTDRIFIVAFNETRLAEGIEAFEKFFLSADPIYLSLSPLYRIDARPESSYFPECITAKDGKYSLSVISYPGTDSYSLTALEKLISVTAPDTVIFNGGLELSASRSTLAADWTTVCACIGSSAAYFRFMPAECKDESGSLAADVLEGLYGEETVLGDECSFVAILSEDGTPLAGQFFVSSCTESSALQAEKLRYYMNLLETAAGEKVPCVVYMSDLPAAVAKQLPVAGGDSVHSGAVFNEEYSSYVSEQADIIYSAALELGVRDFVFSAGYTNAGVYEAGDGLSFAFCGSLDYEGPGVGGKFALNNSLRGLLTVKFDLSEQSEKAIELAYIYTSAYGLNVKNVG